MRCALPKTHSPAILLVAIGLGCSQSGNNSDGSNTQSEVQASASLFAHWPMNEGAGTTVRDATTHGHSAQLVNGAKWHEDVGVVFDGASAYVDAGILELPRTAVTISANFFARDLSNCSSRDCRIISRATGIRSSDHDMMVSTIASGTQTRLRFRLKTDGATSTLIASSGEVPQNKWVHVAAVYDGATMRLYLDGADVGSMNKRGSITSTRDVPTWIGGNPLSATSRPWSGRIRDVRIYNGALTGDQIRALLSSGPNQPPVAHAGPDQQIQLSTGQVQTTVKLDASASFDEDGQITAYRWAGSPDPADSAGPELTLSAGRHVFDLEVEDDSHATASDSVVITVLSAPNGNDLPPVAQMSADVTAGHAPLLVRFDGSKSFDPEGSRLSYRWRFGDGTTSDRVDPTHAFSAGKYRVSLTVTDSGGQQSVSSSLEIDVHDEHTHEHQLPHQDNLGKQSEHLALFDLVERTDATHIAVLSGDWNDADTWSRGMVPGRDSRVLIPEDTTVTVAHEDSARLATVRVDGTLRFDPSRDTRLSVDTLVVDVHGTLQMGTESAPVQANRSAKLLIIDRGPIDLSWDPNMFSRGLISHGTMIAHGAKKTAFSPLAVTPLKGATKLVLSEAPVNWRVGDELVLTGVSPYENQDERRRIIELNGNEVTVNALQYDHKVPESDLQVYVANLSRNVMVESENKIDVLQRGHVMFMHSQKVDIRYFKTVETGRTDKTFAINEIELDSAGRLVPGTGNARGRYALHFHRTGVNETKTPAIATGVVVHGSPGWGMVNHSSFLHARDNVTYNVLGAGFVGEVGNEIGSYRHNIAIRSQGSGEHETDKRQFVSGSEHLGRNDDFGHGGHGFWFQGPLIEVEDNIAAGHRHFGFVFWNRGLVEFDLDPADAMSRVGSTSGSTPKIPVASVMDTQPELTNGVDFVRCEDVMIRRFRNNTTFASGAGLEISRHMRGLSSKFKSLGWRSVIENFTAWNVGHYRNKYGHGPLADRSDGGLFNPQSGDNGISVRYSTRVVLKNPRLLGINESKSTGINHNHFADTNAIVDSVIKRFDQDIRNDGGFVAESSF